MASAPSDPGPVLGRVDRDGRLIAADPELERLQVEAGSTVGASLALPQLAGIVRVAQRLRIPISRRILAAGRDQDIDMWVRAVPEGEEIALSIEHWAARPASQPRLAAISSSGMEGIVAAPLSWSVDEQLRIVDLSPALGEMVGGDPAALAGQPLTRIFRLEESGDGEMPLLAALASRGGFEGQQVVIREGGSRLVLSGEAMPGPDGAFAGFDGFAVPDDSLAASKSDAPIVDKAIHTALRSPLDKIVRSAEQMIEGSGGPVRDEYAAYAADIAAAARHLLSVIRSLGDHPDTPGRQRIDLTDLVDEAVGLMESAARERGILILIEPLDAFMARGDPRGVIQILVNLVGNAIRYTRENTSVTISFETADGHALLHVADEGPGIDSGDQERIFEPFEQGKGGTEGSGLGLAIARRLARAMGGDIRLQSAPGQGSRFTLVLAAA